MTLEEGGPPLLALVTTAFAPVVLALIIPTTSFKNQNLVVFVLLCA